MALDHWPKLTPDLIRVYADAALTNARELLNEASILMEHGYNARAYFLAISSVEETGKALHAFDAQLRNFNDPAVCMRLKTNLKDHRQKINYALSIWALNDVDPKAALQKAMDLVFHLTRGREPSMYSDLRTDPDRVQIPREVVRDVAARDCVRLAEGCLTNAQRHFNEKKPLEATSAQDKFFTMKSNKFHALLSMEDFWWYYIEKMEAGQPDISDAVIGYEKHHLNTGAPFRTK